MAPKKEDTWVALRDAGLPSGAFVDRPDDVVTVDEDLDRLRVAWGSGARGPKRRGRAPSQSGLRRNAGLSAVLEDGPTEQENEHRALVWGNGAQPDKAESRLRRLGAGGSAAERLRLVETLRPPKSPTPSEMSTTTLGNLASEFDRNEDCRSEFSCRSGRSRASACPSLMRHAAAEARPGGESWEQKFARAEERASQEVRCY
ncbi:unnamed protein product [Polarella glacialis]|uniref:Uncharacterized protein n=1 Tax=Polarella glacialis TaxID=89957 RepID=A0A813J8B4_POLGL|nr:unnamed protein product [Polarella glacialis]